MRNVDAAEAGAARIATITVTSSAHNAVDPQARILVIVNVADITAGARANDAKAIAQTRQPRRANPFAPTMAPFSRCRTRADDRLPTARLNRFRSGVNRFTIGRSELYAIRVRLAPI
jgi:hypothetical protein